MHCTPCILKLDSVGKGSQMEDSGKRPGGLTALAVINFILGGLVLLSIPGLYMGKFGVEMQEKELNRQLQEDPNVAQNEKWIKAKEKNESDKETLADPKVKIFTFITVLPGSLLIISGIGYLKQKKMLGRIMGSLYAVISIILGILEIVLIYNKDTKSEFSLLNLIGFIYPVLTLFLLNVTFKDDLVE